MKTNQHRRGLPFSLFLLGLLLFTAGVLVMKYASEDQPEQVAVSPTASPVESSRVAVETPPQGAEQFTTGEAQPLSEQVAEPDPDVDDPNRETAAFNSQPPTPAESIYSDPVPAVQIQPAVAAIQATNNVIAQSQSEATTVESTHVSDNVSYVYSATPAAAHWHQPSRPPAYPASRTYVYIDGDSSSNYSQSAPRTPGKLKTVLTVVVPAAIGAGIGAAAGGGKGAGIGALIGAGGGAAYHLVKNRNRDRTGADNDDDGRPRDPDGKPGGRIRLSVDGTFIDSRRDLGGRFVGSRTTDSPGGVVRIIGGDFTPAPTFDRHNDRQRR